MLSPTLDTIRLVLHVLAASIWVGGQIVVAGIVPGVRAEYPAATRLIARGFGRVAWPAFAVLVITGGWSVADIDVANTSTAYQITLFAKIMLAVLSGAAAALHQFGQSKLALAVGGAVGLLGGLGAFFLGYLLATGV